jgi:hypothetical protein
LGKGDEDAYFEKAAALRSPSVLGDAVVFAGLGSDWLASDLTLTFAGV